MRLHGTQRSGVPEHAYALHYDSIKRGVQAASEIRVWEIQEDYPWVHQVLSPLGGMSVPCEFEEIAARWRRDGVLEHLSDRIQKDDVKLPPQHIGQGPDGVRKDLEALRVFYRMLDGRCEHSGRLQGRLWPRPQGRSQAGQVTGIAAAGGWSSVADAKPRERVRRVAPGRIAPRHRCPADSTAAT